MIKSTSKKPVGMLIFCFFLLIFILCVKSSSNNTYDYSSDVSSYSNKGTLHSGQSLILSDSVLVCSSKDNLNKMLSFIMENNKNGQNQMLLNGQATILSKGTKVNIINTGIDVELENGNKKWFAPYELIK